VVVGTLGSCLRGGCCVWPVEARRRRRDQEQFDDGLHDPGRVRWPANLDGQVADGQQREQIACFFDGLELLEPGIVPLSQWRPEPNLPGHAEVEEFCAVGRKA
jgi:hypothetical protein